MKKILRGFFLFTFTICQRSKDENLNNLDEESGEEIDEEVKEIMKNRGVDEDEAEKIKELMDEEGLDEDEAVALADEF